MSAPTATLAGAIASKTLGYMATSSPTKISDGPISDAPEVDSRNCRLLGPFALIVQGVMGLIVVGSLVFKRQRENPRRKWKVWILDITKQMTGQIFVHFLNIALSNAGSKHGQRNPCSLYFLNIVIDTTLGVFIIYLTLNGLTRLLTDRLGYQGFVSGQYRPPGSRGRPKLEFWIKQLVIYLVALLAMKLFVTVLFLLFPFLIFFGKWLINLFGSHQKAQVFFVMAVVPTIMNVIQFWLIDSFLRHNPDKSPYAKVRTEDDPDLSVDEGAPSAQPDSRYSHMSPPRDSYVVGEEEENDGEGSGRRQGGRDAVQDYGSTLKSPPLRPQASRTLSYRGSIDDLRIEAASVLNEGRPASVRTSSEAAQNSHARV